LVLCSPHGYLIHSDFYAIPIGDELWKELTAPFIGIAATTTTIVGEIIEDTGRPEMTTVRQLLSAPLRTETTNSSYPSCMQVDMHTN
jgi:hypothetical protein